MVTDKERLFGNRRNFWKRLHRLITTIEPWGILVAAIALVLTVVQFWVDYRDRVNERVVRAWTLVTTPAPGNSGKKEALEYLNSEDGFCFDLLGWCAVVLKSRTALVGIDLSHSRIGLSTSPLGSSALELVGRGVYLEHANLPEANFSHANLSGANLFEANLSGATLLNADLSHTFLVMADFSEADLTGVDLPGAFSLEANLGGANLSGADLSGAILPMTTLSEARFFGANLSRVDLRDADLCEADLTGANLSGANLSGAFLIEANLTGANLSGANLAEANVSGADLSKVLHLSQEQLDLACAAPNAPPSVPPHLNWVKRECDTSSQGAVARDVATKFAEFFAATAIQNGGTPGNQRLEEGGRVHEGLVTMQRPRRWPVSNCLSEKYRKSNQL